MLESKRTQVIGGQNQDAGIPHTQPEAKKELGCQREQWFPCVLFSTSLSSVLFVPVGLLISCDFFFNSPYSRLILSNSPAGVL